MPWERPDSVPVGRVWKRFRGAERNGKPAPFYQIRDMEEKDRKRCLDLMQEHFLKDEPLCKVLDILSDPDSVRTIRANWEQLVSQHVSLAVYQELDGRPGEPGELVGFNNLLVCSKEDGDEDIDFDKIKGDSWRKLFRTLVMSEKLVNVFDHYGVNRYLGDSGMMIHPDHRGHSLGVRLLEARENLCQALDIPATVAVFSAVPSQKVAAKAGFELLATLEFKDMMAYGIDLSGCECQCAELRGKKFQFSKN